MPPDRLNDCPADEESDRPADSTDTTPNSDRPAPLFRRIGIADEREGERHDEDGADTLHRPSGNEEADCRCQSRQQGRTNEYREAGAEHLPAAEAIAQCRSCQERQAKAKLWALMVRSGPARPLWNETRRVGRAVVTTREFRNDIIRASEATMSVHVGLHVRSAL